MRILRRVNSEASLKKWNLIEELSKIIKTMFCSLENFRNTSLLICCIELGQNMNMILNLIIEEVWSTCLYRQYKITLYYAEEVTLVMDHLQIILTWVRWNIFQDFTERHRWIILDTVICLVSYLATWSSVEVLNILTMSKVFLKHSPRLKCTTFNKISGCKNNRWRFR